jgi:adenine-specific DNA-methyltransferase
MTEKLKMQANPMDVVLAKVMGICPAAIQNGKVDFNRLREELGEAVDTETKEAYDFTWVGKRAAMVEANKPIRKTLRPVKDESKNWDTTENLYIEGDNLEVLKLLQESYLNKVKMIYIDPPYNTGKDFVYRDNFKQSKEDEIEGIGLFDEEGNKLFRNTETNGRFHSDWCSMIYPRLKLARDFLTDDGVIFISIDDNEVINLRKICDEVFGEDNFIGTFVRRTINSGKQDAITMSVYHEYLLVYTKNITNIKLNRRIKSEQERTELYPLEDKYIKTRGRYYISQLDKGSIQYSDGLNYPILAPDGTEIWPGNGFSDKNKVFRWSKEKVKWGIENDYIVFKRTKNGWKVYAKSYEFRDNNDNEINPSNPYTSLDYSSKDYSNFNATPELQKIFDGKNYFDFPKPVVFIKDLINYATNKNSIILDFFSGSATTAHAVMQLNAEDGGTRKFIMVQLPEETDKDSEVFKAGYNNIPKIARERIRRAGDKIKAEAGLTAQNLDIGFRVLKLDEPNMKDVYYAPSELQQKNLLDSVDNIKNDRSPLDLLFGVMVDWGVSLSLPLTERKIGKNTIYIVGDNDLAACFDTNVEADTIREMAAIKPTRAVFRDASFASDDAKINMVETFKAVSGWDEKQANNNVKVI